MSEPFDEIAWRTRVRELLGPYLAQLDLVRVAARIEADMLIHGDASLYHAGIGTTLDFTPPESPKHEIRSGIELDEAGPPVAYWVDLTDGGGR